MNNKQILDLVLAGNIMTTCEWRSGVARTYEQEDDRTKTKKTVNEIIHQVELLDWKTKSIKPFEIVEEMPADFSPEKWNTSPHPYERGSRTAVLIKSFSWSDNKKVYRGKGQVHALDNAEPRK